MTIVATPSSLLLALAGGALIGLAATMLWAFNGRIAGISGIIGGIMKKGSDAGWRLAFVAGLLAVGIIAAVVHPGAVGALPRAPWMIALAGLFVGVGTRIANGCTSGHGVCGLSRFSVRSFAATATFIGAGVLAVWIANQLPGGAL